APTPTNEVMAVPTQESPTEEAIVPVEKPTIAIHLPLPQLQSGTLTVVALGDSLTEGDGDYPGEGGGFPFRIEKAINTIRPDSQVINFGASGWTSQQMVEGQLPQALEAKPQIAVVWIGSNNLWYNNGPGEGETIDLANYTSNIDTTLRSLTGAGAHVFIALLDDQSLRPYATSPDGANYTPEQLAQMTRLALKFNDIIRAKAAEYQAVTVDFYNTTIFTDPATLAEDGIHPNASGYDIIAKMWFEAIRKIL
ncbi:MAG: SGNH/GDSL hydrolase family protein, partial [Chloroflexia bacterium]